MEGLHSAITAAKDLMDMPLTLSGFTFSFWQVFLWTMVAGLLIWFIGRIFND